MRQLILLVVADGLFLKFIMVHIWLLFKNPPLRSEAVNFLDPKVIFNGGMNYLSLVLN